MLEKGGFIRFVQKDEDGETATKLLEDLREAISDYQASFRPQCCGLLFTQRVQMTQQIAIYSQSSTLIVSQFYGTRVAQLSTHLGCRFV